MTLPPWKARPPLVEILVPILAGLLCAALGCSSSAPSEPRASLPSTLPVTLPNGEQILAELALTPQEHQRGLMFREALDPGRGMLFIFPASQRRPFWMYQTRIPLDIIWLDEDRRIVEISANTPPCPSPNAAGCPNYGGNVAARYVLELAGGQAEAHGLQVGDELRF